MRKPRKAAAEAPGLFGAPPAAVVKETPPAEPVPANRIPAEPTAAEYIAAWQETIPQISDPMKADAALARWSLEDDVRARLGWSCKTPGC